MSIKTPTAIELKLQLINTDQRLPRLRKALGV